jgi:hypothetical protein
MTTFIFVRTSFPKPTVIFLATAIFIFGPLLRHDASNFYFPLPFLAICVCALFSNSSETSKPFAAELRLSRRSCCALLRSF